MRANTFQKYWILLQTVATTARFSSAVILRYYFKKLNRRAVDSILERWSTRLLKIVKARYTVHNPHQVQFKEEHKYIIMSNHASHYDIPLLMLALPGSMRMVAKQELFKIPLFGAAMRKAEFVAIDRENKEEAKRNLLEAQEKMRSGIRLWVAPEGKRTFNGQLGEFKKGGFMIAHKTQAHIIPVTIKGARGILPAGGLDFEIGQEVDIFIGQPLDVSEYGILKGKQLMADVEQQIRNHL